MGIPKFISNLYRDAAGKFDPVKAATSAGLGALAYGALKPESGLGEFITGKKQQPVGYTGGIPEYGVSRALLPNAFATTAPSTMVGPGMMEPRVPGSGGRRYFTDMTYTPTGDTMSAAINPVNVPVTTRAPAGVFDGLSAEEAQFFFNKLFSGQGISNSGGTTTGGTTTGGTTTGGTTTGGTTTGGTTGGNKFTNAQVNETLSALNKKYAGDSQGLYRAVAQQIKNSGVPIADAAKQIAASNFIVDGKPVSAEQIADTYKTLGYKDTPKYTESDVRGTLDALIANNKTIPTLYQAIGEQIKAAVDAGVSLDDAAKQVATYYRPDMNDLSKRFTADQIKETYKQMGFAQGGLASLPQSQGYYLGGATDGMADRIPANINGSQPAALSDGEFVMPADVVSHLGNGNSDAGAKVLYSMMDRVRQARTGTKEQGRKITPNKFTPV